MIWIGCPPFEAEAAATILPTRLARLDGRERAEAVALMARLAEDEDADVAAFTRLGRLFARADARDPIVDVDPEATVRVDVFRAVWPEGAALRASGALKARLAELASPVVAFHGEDDPHPIAAIAAAGAVVRSGFRLRRLTACGHAPWRERAVREVFERELAAEIERLIDSPAKTGGDRRTK